MKITCFKKTGKIYHNLDKDLEKIDKIYIRNLCASEHFYNRNQESLSILPENGPFNPFFDPTVKDHNES